MQDSDNYASRVHIVCGGKAGSALRQHYAGTRHNNQRSDCQPVDARPLRGACISLSNGKTITTPWDGKYCITDTAFATASITRNGFLTRHLRRDEFTDTLFLLPASRTIAEVTVWGKRGNQANLFTPMTKTDAELAEIGGNMGGNLLGLLLFAAEKLKILPDFGKKRRMWEEKQRMVIDNY